MKEQTPVAVTSRSFSKHPVLRAELLEKYEHVTFNDAGKSLKGEELVQFLKGHGKAIIALEKIDAGVLAQLPDLKVIGKFGVGLDSFDLNALQKHGVLLGWQGGTNKRSVSELALTLMLALLRHVPLSSQELKAGAWKQNKGQTLSQKTVGLLGFGNVGKDLATLLRAFGCEILCFDLVVDESFYNVAGVKRVGMDELLSRSDVVSVHFSVTEKTRNILNAQKLALMKPSAILVNTARGGLVDEDALKVSLKEKKIAAAGFDVFAVEPFMDSELLSLPNFLATPHIGGSTEEAIVAMGRAAIAGLAAARPALDYLK